MRTALIAFCGLAFTAMFTATASAQDMTGAWRARGELGEGQQHYHPDQRDYFSADLREQDGRISGAGVIDLCPTCRGYNEYAINWVGRRDGDRIALHGTYPVRWFETPVIFTGRISADGARVEGELTNKRNEFRQGWVMLRERNGAAAEEAPGESR